jgi:hypothetical protein
MTFRVRRMVDNVASAKYQGCGAFDVPIWSDGGAYRDRDADARQLHRSDPRLGRVDAPPRHAVTWWANAQHVASAPFSIVGSMRSANDLCASPSSPVNGTNSTFGYSSGNNSWSSTTTAGRSACWARAAMHPPPIDYHDAARRLPAHGRSPSGVPSSSSSLRASECLAR